jgi:hypothetical protein
MKPFERSAQRRKLPARAQRLQHVEQVDCAHGPFDATAQPALRHARSRWIDRSQRRRQRLAIANHPDPRMHHLDPGESAACHAEAANASADFQLLDLRRIEVQETQHQRAARVVAHCDAQLPSAAEHDICSGDGTFDLRFVTFVQCVDRYDHGFVFVAQRQVQDEIPVTAQPDGGQARSHVTAGGRRGGAGASQAVSSRGPARPRLRTERPSAGSRRRRWNVPDTAEAPLHS